MPARLSPLLLLLCALTCVSETLQKGGRDLIPDCSEELGSNALIRPFRRPVYKRILGALKEIKVLEYSCFLEERARARIIDPELYEKLTMRMNIMRTEHEEKGDQISVRDFVKRAVRSWRYKLEEMGHVRKFGCNYQNTPFKHRDGYNISKHKLVCLFLKE